MKFTPIPKLIKEEVMGKPLDNFLNKFIVGYNSLIEQQSSIFSSNITIADNLRSKTYDFNGITGTAASSKTIAWPHSEAPTEVRIARFQQVSGLLVGHIALTAGPWLEWSYTSGKITFAVKGLVAAETYNIRIIGVV